MPAVWASIGSSRKDRLPARPAGSGDGHVPRPGGTTGDGPVSSSSRNFTGFGRASARPNPVAVVSAVDHVDPLGQPDHAFDRGDPDDAFTCLPGVADFDQDLHDDI